MNTFGGASEVELLAERNDDLELAQLHSIDCHNKLIILQVPLDRSNRDAYVERMNSPRILATTGLAPAIWGTTYLTTTQLLPAGRPLLAVVLRALPAGLVLIAISRRLPDG